MSQQEFYPYTPPYTYEKLIHTFKWLGYYNPCGESLLENKVFLSILKEIAKDPNYRNLEPTVKYDVS